MGKGLPLFTEKGSIIRRELEKFVINEEIKRGYQHVYTPELAKVELYKTSGHYPYYKDSMYPVMKIDEEEFILRPMTCPHHFQLYASQPRSYKELPFRIAELAKQFRYEKSGELTGLIRVRSFCLADAHIICQKDEALSEIKKVFELIEYMSQELGLKVGVDYRYRLSLGDRKDSKKYYKDDAAWSFAENALRQVLVERKSPFFETEKEAAFYGPKIDVQMKNFAGKEDTAFTIQYDFVMPKRFNLTYIDKDGQKKEPIVIHRSSIGAIERTMAFLLEHYAGALPFWLSPVQIHIIPIADRHLEYAQKVKNELKDFRVEINDAQETLGKKIREAEMQKIPYILVVGDKEIASNAVGVRERGKGDLGTVTLDNFIKNTCGNSTHQLNA
ncbi:MAG: Threonine-tRNA ligase [Parcubacteria group bacterium GW2011_GWF2_43_11]|nr:MAG: Threonine-tRNA ligase [Parcubacteria group bacterium GW2011_GWF2_43_11]